ncbi:MAG: amino acid adenylation domain-containing protein [Planctomycetaceae bacterium]
MPNFLHDNLTHSALAYPNKDAFRCDSSAITYKELDESSSRMAGLLQALGVRKGDCVGVRLRPSIESAISVYGILKAGAAFVPIDPNAPNPRLAELVSTGNIRIVVTSQLGENVAACLERAGVTAVIGGASEQGALLKCLPFSAIHEAPTHEPVTIDTACPAYVIFTSGSTGTPKGIIHTHSSGQAYARLSVETYGVTSADRIGNLSPLHFDMATFGYLSAVLAGATTVLIPQSYASLPASLSSLIESELLTIWYSVPHALIQLLERGVLATRDLTNLRWVMFGGEPFAGSQLRRLREILPYAAFSNVYGPAEVNQCTFHNIGSANSGEAAPAVHNVPIGRVWKETCGLVVDGTDSQVSRGEQGQLLIHSTTMMSRYWNGTEEDPTTFFISDDGRRYYRTGDLVTEAKNGDLIFHGRMDDQVKIRGYRIELSEVEQAIAALSFVEENAVFRSGSAETSMLEAAVKLRRGQAVTKSQLCQLVSGKLPRYAVPSKVHFVDTFPRTSSGKIDRNALQHSVENNKQIEPV